MKMQECKRFDRCSANICPLDPLIKKRTWYLDEDICPRPEFKEHPAIFAQKRIKKRWKKGRKIMDMAGIRKRLTTEDETGLWTGEELIRVGKYMLAQREKKRERAKNLFALRR